MFERSAAGRTPAALLLSGMLTGACGPAIFSQDIGPAHKVKPGMTFEEARAILGPPVQTVSLEGVDEWRYCATRPNGDVFVVLYFQDQRVIDKANFTLQLDRQGDENSCRDTVDRIYTDRRSPPRRVQELRQRASRR